MSLSSTAPLITTLIFDLSEVLVAGLIGIEKPLAEQLRISEEAVLPAFGGELLENLCRGKMSEDLYLTTIVEQQQWSVSIRTLKNIIRENLNHRVAGTVEVLKQLKPQCQLVLLSDHALEWVDYIRSIHPFLEAFDAQVFSCESGQIKSEPSTFHSLLTMIDRSPEECLFVDDNPRNVQAASAVGIAGITFTDAGQLVEGLAEYGLSVERIPCAKGPLGG